MRAHICIVVLALVPFVVSCEDDTPSGSVCANGVVEPGETCDGNCPADCDDGNTCTVDSMSGNVASCNASCSHRSIAVCEGGDECCPAGCTTATDDDCSILCGNGLVESDETCDGNCPATCNDGNACTIDVMTGSATTCNVDCSVESIDTCADGDGCCPAACDSSTDNDCSVSCGNDVVEVGETCDGNCPTDCDDSNACTVDLMTGSASNCSVACSYLTISVCDNDDGCCPIGCDSASDADCSPYCGNGVLDTEETCDGNCPFSCNDGNACTVDTMTGSAESCSVACSYAVVSECVDGDGCCPATCRWNTDSDCSAACGNGVVEVGETCDGDCPVDCDDGNTCTTDLMTGSEANCSLDCTFVSTNWCEDDDGCCPAGCTIANDNDCSTFCGNGVIDGGETCDGNCPSTCNDGNACTIDIMTGSADNCSVDCTRDVVSDCVSGDGCCPAACDASTDNDCSPYCGNGALEVGETCDGNCPSTCNDGNACTIDLLTGSADNCSVDCSYLVVSTCSDGDRCCPAGCNIGNDGDCSSYCGDGVVDFNETCDGDCLVSCLDGDSCTEDLMTGSAANCNVACTHSDITECVSGESDGCCPPGCTADINTSTASTDLDCLPVCGNDVAEGLEECDRTDVRDATCADFGYGGSVYCDNDCRFYTGQCFECQWSTTTTYLGVVNSAEPFIETEMDSEGRLHIAARSPSSNELIYYTWDGRESIAESVISSGTTSSIGCVEMVLDSQDQPHFVTCWPDDLTLIHTYWDGDSWVNEPVDVDNDVGQSASLAIGDNDTLFIAYHSSSVPGLMYSVRRSTGWDAPSTIAYGPNTGLVLSVALRSIGPSITYVDADGSPELIFTQLYFPNWLYDTVDVANVTDVDLSFDTNDQPRIVYLVDWSSANEIRSVRSYTMQVETVIAPTMSLDITGLSMVLDAAGEPHVVFGSADTDHRYHVYANGEWTARPLPATTGLVPSIALDYDAYLDIDATVVEAAYGRLLLRHVKCE